MMALVMASCARCGYRTICQGGLCLHCREIHLWSLTNRAFCALIHRDSPMRNPDPRTGPKAA